MKAATRLTCKSFIVALAVAAAADVVQHRPAVPTYCQVAKRAAPPKPYGGVHLRLEDDLRGYAAFMRSRLGVRTNFELMARTKALEACAAGSTKLYVAVGLDDVSDRAIAAPSPQIRVHDVGAHAGEDKSLLEKGKGPFGATLVFKDGGDIARRFGEAAASVGAIVDTVVLADAAYYVGYAGLSTFDRTLVDIRATRDQWDARLARPDNCTFTVGKNTQRGVADHDPNAPAGRVYMRHFRSLP